MERLKGIDLVAGMVLFTKDGSRYIVFPVQIVNQRFAFANLDGGWTTYLSEDAIIKINTPPRGKTIDSGVTLWKRPCELSMKEIAEAFGISVEELRIKKE